MQNNLLKNFKDPDGIITQWAFTASNVKDKKASQSYGDLVSIMLELQYQSY